MSNAQKRNRLGPSAEDHELPRVSRGHSPNASSARSKSTPGWRPATVGEASRSQLSSLYSPSDAKSQGTAVSSEAIKTREEMQAASGSAAELANIPIGSVRSNSTGGNGNNVTSVWNEDDLPMPKARLTVFDVAALVLNKQIGTGIFTTPGTVLLSTQSKGLSVGLWTLGGFWTLMFLLIYLEFGDAFPYNGGELVYLDEIYHNPELLATILFSGFFLLLANSYGNSIQFAKHILVAAIPDLQDSTQLDSRLVRFIAISALTFVCLIHWHSSRAGLFLNKLVALFKILLLVVVVIAGMSKSSGSKSKWSDSGNSSSASDGMAGMVLIFYSYQGWENANYVAGEIRASAKKTSKTTLNIGATLGVMTTWVLYVLVTVTIYRVLEYNDLTGPHADLAVVLKFAPRVFGGTTGLKICMAISALGNILAVTYTASKVKQSIAIQRILPFWRYLQADEETPKGALTLHWLSSVIFIAFAPSSSDGYSFAVGFYTYGHILFSILVAIGLVRLKRRMDSSRRPDDNIWNYTFFRSKPLLYTVPIIFALGNVLILVFAGKTHAPGKIPRWWWPIVTFITLAASALYWAGIHLLMMGVKTDNNDTQDKKTFGDVIGLSVRVVHKGVEDPPSSVAEDADETLAAKLDGSQRRVLVETHGWLAGVEKFFGELGKLLGRYLF